MGGNDVKLGRLLTVLCSTDRERARCAACGDLEITAIVNDSRYVTPGSLFVALRGAKADGHLFVPGALKSGAVAVVTERPIAL